MGRKREEDQIGNKVEALKKYHALNPHPEKVKDETFLKGTPFFDSRDLVQVKYEMLRQVKEEKRSVTDVASSFGFSRPSFYQARDAFEQRGLPGLLPKYPGPKRSHKLCDEVMDFVESIIVDDDSVTSDYLAVMIGEKFGISIHPRSVERAIIRRKKND
ncbi:MAG: helix-turn-helix domain-containing protein [Candidatus Aegiribacteria sp.]|nr:helix-turn-helix domain-containing protein [Candidatus Aegiribacteria sp.]